jgi:type II secretory ATPase GspE/PulE/Tfp pilus assembly ATPase PilB-like protein
MPRLLLFAASWLVVVLGASSARAETTWPEWIGPFDPPQFPRGPGFYFSIVKIVLSYAVLFAWVKSTDWVNCDAVRLKLPYRRWNAICFFPFAAAFLLLWIIPWFSLSFPLLLLTYGGTFGWYVWSRNKGRHEADKVFTKDHLKHLFANQLKLVGVKVPEMKQKAAAVPVTLSPRGAANQSDEQMRAIAARQSPGAPAAKALVFKALQSRASGIMVDFSQEAAVVKLLIDSVWLDAETQPRQLADPMLASFKLLCGLKPDERRARQAGTFLAVEDATRTKHPAKLTSQGTKTGERVLIQFEDAQTRKRRLPDLALRQKLQDELQALMNLPKGLILIAAPAGGGLTSLTTVCLAAVDRFTRSALAVEDIRSKDLEVENIPITPYDSLEQETPMAKLPQVLRQFPDVLVVPEYVDAETLGLLCDEAREERLVITTLRAREAAEAFLRPLQTKVSPKKYALAVSGVIVQRLIRKLCEKCREAYPPPPQILQRLGIPPEKVQAFYRPPTQPRQEVCPECNGLGYRGLTALVEVLTLTDALRQQFLAQPTIEGVRTAARKAGMKTMEDEGLLLVVKGVTSVPELARVLKEGAPAPAAPAAS